MHSNLTLEKAKEVAVAISLEKRWDYIQVIKISEDKYKVDRYYEDGAKFYAYRGKLRKH